MNPPYSELDFKPTIKRMGLRFGARDKVLFTFGLILAVFIGAVATIRFEQLQRFRDISSGTLAGRRVTVQSWLRVWDTEAQSALQRASHGLPLDGWTSDIDPDLIPVLIERDGQIAVRPSSANKELVSYSRIKNLVQNATPGVARSAVWNGVPVQYWSMPVPKGVAMIVRVWDSKRIIRFQSIANCQVQYTPPSKWAEAKETSSLEAAWESQVLLGPAGKSLGWLQFRMYDKGLDEGVDNATEAAGMIIACALTAFGVLFIVLHRTMFEPVRVIGKAIAEEAIEPDSIVLRENDEFGKISRQLQMVFIQKRLLHTANAELERNVKNRTLDLEEAYDATILGFSRAMELRDKETDGHCQRVAIIADRIAESLGLWEEERNLIRRGALLHDIGKLGIPDAILLKPGPLTPDEMKYMQRHTEFGYEMLRSIPFLKSCLDIPHYHHERWDGTGYPTGLRGEAIPLSARIFSIADVYDALRSDRPYREGMSDQEARDYIRNNAGTQFDPLLIDVFEKLECHDLWAEIDARKQAGYRDKAA